MNTTSPSGTARRGYKRRSTAERLQDLESRLQALKAKQVEKEKQEDPVLRAIPRLQAKLQKFVSFAVAHGRLDLANTVRGYSAGLERILRAEQQALADESDTSELE